MNWLIRQIAKVTLIGKLVEKLGPKVPIIFIFLVSCNYNQNVNKIPKKSGSTLKVTKGGVEAKID